MRRVAFITNFCPHYRVRTFEMLSRYYDVEYYFFSAGDEWYWQREHGTSTGEFAHRYLPGFRIGKTRVTPSLPFTLWSGHYDAYVKCINGRFALPIAYLVARLRRKPIILWTGIWTRMGTVSHRLLFPFTRWMCQHVDAIVVYGEHVTRYLVSEGVPPERIFRADHAIDNETYSREVTLGERSALRTKLGIGPTQKVILYLGRLEPVKGLIYLISAFADLQRDDIVLVIAGSGSDKASLEEAATQARIADRVRFSGYVPVEEAVGYYSLAWAFILPSITLPQGKETWGLVVNEAFNQGVPVITTDAVGAAAGGLVQHGVNGFIVPERNSPALVQALQQLLDDPSLRERMSRNAKRTIAGWDNERMVLGFREAIEYAVNAETKQ